MSFARKVKEELREQLGKSKHCQLAELAAYFALCGQIVLTEDDGYEVKFQTENLTVLEKSYILVRKALWMTPELSVRGGHQFFMYLIDSDMAATFIQKLRVEESAVLVADEVIDKSCCKRAFLRGLFVASGSITDPNSGYHLEIMAGSYARAEKIQQIIGSFDVDSKIVERKKNYVVYMKEGAAIVDFLNIIGAHSALMEYENVRILKEMRNSINRKVNCETANIQKTVSAASRQVQDIQYIHDTMGFGNLTDSLAEIARVRLEHPDTSLKELGELLDPPIGKSGVNHRLRKLSEIAEKQRKKDGTLGGKND